MVAELLGVLPPPLPHLPGRVHELRDEDEPAPPPAPASSDLHGWLATLFGRGGAA